MMSFINQHSRNDQVDEAWCNGRHLQLHWEILKNQESQFSLVKRNLTQEFNNILFFSHIGKSGIYIIFFFEAQVVQVFYKQKRLLKTSAKAVTASIRKVIDSWFRKVIKTIDPLEPLYTVTKYQLARDSYKQKKQPEENQQEEIKQPSQEQNIGKDHQ